MGDALSPCVGRKCRNRLVKIASAIPPTGVVEKLPPVNIADVTYVGDALHMYLQRLRDPRDRRDQSGKIS